MKLHPGAAALAVLFVALNLRAADGPATVSSFGAFGKIDPAELSRGVILTQANTSMKFDRGISAQACYVVAQSPEVVARLLQTWDPSGHAELETYQYHAFHDATDAQFETLKINPGLDPMRR